MKIKIAIVLLILFYEERDFSLAGRRHLNGFFDVLSKIPNIRNSILGRWSISCKVPNNIPR